MVPMGLNLVVPMGVSFAVPMRVGIVVPMGVSVVVPLWPTVCGTPIRLFKEKVSSRKSLFILLILKYSKGLDIKPCEILRVLID